MPEKFANKYRIPSARLAKWDYCSHAAYFVTICTHNRVNYFGQVENGNMNLSGVGIIADILWYEMANHAKIAEPDVFVVMPNHIHGIVIIKGNDDIATAIGDDIVNHGAVGGGIVNQGAIIDVVVDRGAVETLHATSLQTNVPVTIIPTTNVPVTIIPTTNVPVTIVPTTNVPATIIPTTNVPATIIPIPNVPATIIPTTENHPPTNPKNQTMANISPKSGSLSAIIRSYKSAVSRHANRLGFQFAWQPRFHDHIIRDENEYLRIRQYIINNPKNWSNDKFHNQ